MKKIKKIGLLLGIGFMLVNNVSAKEMKLVDSGFLFNKETKKIVYPKDNRLFEVSECDKDSSWNGYNVEYKGQKYFVSSKNLVDPDLYNKYLSKNKVKMIPKSNNDIYNYVDFINTNQYLKNIVENFNPVSKSDLEQVKEVMIYIKMLNLRYAWNDEISQWNSIQYGYSACHGIAYLQKLLLDKTNLEYRVVFEEPVNYLENKVDPVSPAHIFLDVKIDGKFYSLDATQLLRGKNQESEVSFEQAKKSIDYMLSNILLQDADYTQKSKGHFKLVRDVSYPDVVSRVSGTYKQNRKIKDDGFDAWYSSKSLDEFLQGYQKGGFSR